MHRLRLSLIALVLAAPTLAPAEEALRYDQIRFATDATREVEQDVLRAVLYVQHEADDPRRAADQVNLDMDWALQQTQGEPAVQYQTLGYQTTPSYDKGKLQHWRVRQSLSLVSRDSTRLSAMIGNLQQRLAVQSVSYEISDASRRVVEQELIDEALQRFRQRAEQIVKAMGRSSYRLIEVNLDGGGITPTPRYAVAAMEASVRKAPSFEAGTQEMQVRAQGSIELRD